MIEILKLYKFVFEVFLTLTMMGAFIFAIFALRSSVKKYNRFAYMCCMYVFGAVVWMQLLFILHTPTQASEAWFGVAFGVIFGFFSLHYGVLISKIHQNQA